MPIGRPQKMRVKCLRRNLESTGLHKRGTQKHATPQAADKADLCRHEICLSKS